MKKINFSSKLTLSTRVVSQSYLGQGGLGSDIGPDKEVATGPSMVTERDQNGNETTYATTGDLLRINIWGKIKTTDYYRI